MKGKLTVFAVAGSLLAAVAVPGVASAHSAPPCNDTDGDGNPSGAEYAQHHIRPMAMDGALGNGGHKPGTHHGFSLCDPSSLAPGR